MVTLNKSVWPTMITPLDDDFQIDYNGLEHLVEWYLERGVDGLFTACMSSEIFFLNAAERRDMSRFIVKISNRRVPVIASGNLLNTPEEQIEEVKALADTGVDAVVLLTNRFVEENESDEEWKKQVDNLLTRTPNIPLGLYECPYPYKRLLSKQLLRWCASTERFGFMKDTCCDLPRMRERVEVLRGSNLKVFNASASTLLPSLEIGVDGYSGVMANFHPQLYVWLTRSWATSPEKAASLQNFLGLASLIEWQPYPVNAKYYLGLEGLEIKLNCRSRNTADFTPANRIEVQQLRALTNEYCRKYEVRI